MENIQVTLRIRPLHPKELQIGESCIWTLDPSNSKIEIKPQNIPQKAPAFARSVFSFDEHYISESSNKEIYQKSIKPLILTSLDGINTTIFMYGQTGSGKTYTILGDKQFLTENIGEMFIDRNKKELGILLLSINELFERIRKDEEKTYMIKCSYIEIYNDNVFDLLKPMQQNAFASNNITINEDTNKEFFLKGVTEHCINSCEEILEMLKQGEINRHYAETAMNHVSSRSHTIFRIAVTTFTNSCIRQMRKEAINKKFNLDDNLNIISQDKNNNLVNDQETLVTESYINFVDLAGSEKISTNFEEDENRNPFSFNNSNTSNNFDNGLITKEMSNSCIGINKEKRVKEGQFINKSLFFLTQVIALKSEGKNNLHIPYRNSPLTKILKSSLGGNSRTMIILCLNPTVTNLDNSLTTLRFGLNAKKIQNKIETNIVTKNGEEAFKRMVKEYEKRLTDLEISKNEYKVKYENLFLDYKDMLDKSLRMKAAPVSSNNLLLPEKEEQNNLLEYHFNNIGLIFLNNKNQTCWNYLTSNKKVKRNFQELLFDNVGKYACFAYSKLKEKCKILEESLNFSLEKQKEFSNYHLEIYKEALKTREKYIKYKNKFKTIEKISYLSNEDLSELISTASNILEKAKTEKISRVYKKEIKELKSQISNIPNSPSPVKNTKKFFEIDLSKSLNDEQEHVSKCFIQLNPTKISNNNNYNFEEFESKFLNNPINFDFIYEKKNNTESKNLSETKFSPKSLIPPINKPVEKVSIDNNPKKTVPKSLDKRKRTKSVLPSKPTTIKHDKRGVSVEKSVENSSFSSNKKAEDLSKLKELIEDKKILAETFVLNKPNNINITNNNHSQIQKNPNESFHKNGLINFKQDAENLKDFVQKVSSTVHENMENLQAKMQNPKNCHLSDFFSEKDFFSNEKHHFFEDKNLLESENQENKLLDQSNHICSDFNQSSMISGNFEDNYGGAKKRRTRAERNSKKF